MKMTMGRHMMSLVALATVASRPIETGAWIRLGENFETWSYQLSFCHVNGVICKKNLCNDFALFCVSDYSPIQGIRSLLNTLQILLFSKYRIDQEFWTCTFSHLHVVLVCIILLHFTQITCLQRVVQTVPITLDTTLTVLTTVTSWYPFVWILCNRLQMNTVRCLRPTHRQKKSQLVSKCHPPCGTSMSVRPFRQFCYTYIAERKLRPVVHTCP